MYKRQNTVSNFVIPRTKRPINKELIAVNSALSSAAQINVTLYTATYPCTITGLRWGLDVKNVVASDVAGVWIIYVVRQGQTVVGISDTTASTVYSPEEEVMAWGTYNLCDRSIGSEAVATFEGSTKTMRKLQGGDKLGISATCSDIDGALLYGIVQFFNKA